MQDNILILGAGPAGLACALELEKSNISSIIIEKQDEVGGLAKTFTFKGNFLTDLGPHRFYSKNQYINSLLKDLLGKDLLIVKRKTRQLIHRKFYDYPVKAAQALKNIGFLNSIKIAIDYFLSIINYKLLNKKINNFEDYIIANFGRTLGEFNMLNYTEKIWGLPCSKISLEWATQRIKGLNLISAFYNAVLGKLSKSPRTLADHFYYPKYGTGTIYKAIEKRLRSKIYKKTYPTKITHSRSKITDVRLNTGKHIKPKILVESVPITEFIHLLSPKPPKEVIKASKNLKWRSQIYIFITVNKKQITDDNWLYFPTKDVPFGRAAEMKNFSEKMSPKGKTSFMVEYFVSENDALWNLPKKQLFNLTIKHIEELGFFKQKDVVDRVYSVSFNDMIIYDIFLFEKAQFFYVFYCKIE
jgi:protoporphyrinogen oxidase